MSDVAFLQAERERLAALVHRIAQEGESKPHEFFNAVLEHGRIVGELNAALTHQQPAKSA